MCQIDNEWRLERKRKISNLVTKSISVHYWIIVTSYIHDSYCWALLYSYKNVNLSSIAHAQHSIVAFTSSTFSFSSLDSFH